MQSQQPDGMDELTRRTEARIRRTPRVVPPPRKSPTETATMTASSSAAQTPPSAPEAPVDASSRVAAGRDAAPRPQRPPGRSQRPPLSPEDPIVNLGVRIRRPIDDRLSQVILSLRSDGVRFTSKAELVEMLLWELPPVADDQLKAQLRTFREATPRDTL